MIGTKKEIDSETRVEVIKKRLLDRIENGLELAGDGSQFETKWKAAGILQGLCAAYASLERLSNVKPS